MSLFVLMAGGTGGHLFPAMALAQELRRRGHDVRLMTDHRVSSYGDKFPATQTYIVPSATPSVRNPIKFAVAAAKLGWGTLVARRTLKSINPDAVIGFGGYPVFPPFLAASMLKIPGILHEQNAVMGRANRALAERAAIIALTFPETIKAESFKDKSQLVGNPLRDRVIAVVNTPYPSTDSELRLLVTGGSQGARIFADLVPPAIAELPADLRARLRVTQQARPEDLERVAEAYRQSKVNVELQSFFDDLPERIAKSHLIISRAGASTVTELTAIGRPALYVPLPGSLDADQRNNARHVEDAGGGWIVEQATVSPQSLGTRLASLFGDPATLKRAAAAAKSLGQPKAVAKLADLAEGLAGRGNTP
jgi:UDP-N-acetylglucosamine--N-acetylmuramyl-(pentapeptide) pyrophosphoryl-undecaprenol N-acetylglucosamine transferase